MRKKWLAILAAIFMTAWAGLTRAVEPPLASTQPAGLSALRPIEPTRLTLHFKDAPVIDVIKSIQWQTGLSLFQNRQFMLQFVDKKIMSIDVDAAPFWSVIREVNDKAGLSMVHVRDNAGHIVVFVPSRGMGAHAADDSAELISVKATGAQLNRSMQYNNSGGNNSLTVGLQVTTDPAIDLARATCEASVIEAVDENGASLAPSDGGTKRVIGRNKRIHAFQNMLLENNSSQVWLSLRDSTTNGKTIARLQGAVSVHAASPVHPVKVLDPTAGSQVSDGGNEIRIVNFYCKDNKYTLEFQMHPSASAIKWDPTGAMQNTYSVIDPDGDLFRGQSIDLDRARNVYSLTLAPVPQNENNALMMQANIAVLNNPPIQPQAPEKSRKPASGAVRPPAHTLLVINVPAAPIDFSVPFELKDLPLP